MQKFGEAIADKTTPEQSLAAKQTMYYYEWGNRRNSYSQLSRFLQQVIPYCQEPGNRTNTKILVDFPVYLQKSLDSPF